MTYSRGMGNIQIFIGFFCIFPADIAKTKVTKLGFEHKFWWFFHKTRNTGVPKVKTNQSTRKYNSRRLFWYQLHLLTPNSEGERLFQRCHFEYEIDQATIRWHSFTFPLYLKQIAPWLDVKSTSHLWMDRSPSLLGVRSCNWYQNNRSELYFRVLCFVFTFETQVFQK